MSMSLQVELVWSEGGAIAVSCPAGSNAVSGGPGGADWPAGAGAAAVPVRRPRVKAVPSLFRQTHLAVRKPVPSHRRLQPLVDLAVRKHIGGGQLVQRPGADEFQERRRRAILDRPAGKIRAADDVDESRSSSRLIPASAETPRICSISARVTGWR